MARAYNRVLVLHVFKLPHLNLERHLGLRDNSADGDMKDEDTKSGQDQSDGEDSRNDIFRQASAISPAAYDSYLFHDLEFEDMEKPPLEHDDLKKETAISEQDEKFEQESKGDSSAAAGNEELTATKYSLSSSSAKEMKKLASYISHINLLIMPRYEIEKTLSAIFYKVRDIQMIMRSEADNFEQLEDQKRKVCLFEGGKECLTHLTARIAMYAAIILNTRCRLTTLTLIFIKDRGRS